jgi:hypothetical protein
MAYKDLDKRIKEGLCTHCPSKAKPFYRRCEKCLEKDRVASRVRANRSRKRRMKNNECYKCGRPLHEDADEGKLSCVTCRRGW